MIEAGHYAKGYGTYVLSTLRLNELVGLVALLIASLVPFTKSKLPRPTSATIMHWVVQLIGVRESSV